MLFGRKDSTPENSELEMGFFEHLEELRMRLLLSILAILVCSVLGFVYAREIIAFLMVPLRRAMSGMPLPAQLHYTSLTEPLFQSFKIALFAGLMLAFPYWVWQAWRFIAPGLLDKEKRLAAPILLSATSLFVAGVSFAYIIAVPTAYRFLLMYASAPPAASKSKGNDGLVLEWKPVSTVSSKQKKTLKVDRSKLHLRLSSSVTKKGKRWKLHLKTRRHKTPRSLLQALIKKKNLDVLLNDDGKTSHFKLRYQWSLPTSNKGTLTPILTLKAYLGVSTWFLFGFGLVFQTPMVIFLLSVIGLLSPYTLSKYRRHAFVAILIVASILTPTGDPINLMIMAVPMYILFEIGLLVSKLFLRARGKGEDDEDDDEPPPGGTPPPSPPDDNSDEPLDPEDNWAAYQAQLAAELDEEFLQTNKNEGMEVPPETLVEDEQGESFVSDAMPDEDFEDLDEEPSESAEIDEVVETVETPDFDEEIAASISQEVFEGLGLFDNAPDNAFVEKTTAVEDSEDSSTTDTALPENPVNTDSDAPSAAVTSLPDFSDEPLEEASSKDATEEDKAQETGEEENDEFLPPALQGWGQSIGGIGAAAGKRPQILPPQGDVFVSTDPETVENNEADTTDKDAASSQTDETTSADKGTSTTSVLTSGSDKQASATTSSDNDQTSEDPTTPESEES